MRPVRIDSRAEFAKVLGEARAETSALRTAMPDLEVLEVVDAQLGFLAARTADGAEPSVEDQAEVEVGPLAVRNFEDTRPAYATLLKELDYAFRRYEALP